MSRIDSIHECIDQIFLKRGLFQRKGTKRGPHLQKGSPRGPRSPLGDHPAPKEVIVKGKVELLAERFGGNTRKEGEGREEEKPEMRVKGLERKEIEKNGPIHENKVSEAKTLKNLEGAKF